MVTRENFISASIQASLHVTFMVKIDTLQETREQSNSLIDTG